MLARAHPRSPQHPGAVYREIFGSLLVAGWHAQVGVQLTAGVVSRWDDFVGGRQLSAPTAPRSMTYVADSAFKRAAAVPHSVVAATSCVTGSSLTQLFAAASRPWMLSIMRFTALTGSLVPVVCSDGGGNSNPVLFATGGTIGGLAGSSLAFSDATTAHVFEQGFSAAGLDSVGVDGVYNSFGSASSTTGARNSVCVGGNVGGVGFPTSAAHALHLFFTSRPSTTQIARATAAAKHQIGF